MKLDFIFVNHYAQVSINHVNKKYNKPYSARGMHELLHKIGSSSKKPRQTQSQISLKRGAESF